MTFITTFPDGLLVISDFTHHGLVEGPIGTSNAYSVVDVLEDCSVVVKGYGNASSVTHPGPPGCTIGKKTEV